MSGLRIDIEEAKLNRHLVLGSATGRKIPSRIDHRVELPPTSDQGLTSECALYTFAGAIEYERWKWKGICEQIDPHPLYLDAKKHDGISGEGTTLEAGLQACQNMKVIPKVDESSIRVLRTLDEVRRALHRYGVVVAGFSIDKSWGSISSDGWISGGGESYGGHASLVCGFADDDEKWFAGQGSWGDKPNTGWHGFWRMTPELFEKQFRYGIVWDYHAPKYR